MDELKNYTFTGAFRLLDVQNHDGISKASEQKLYSDRIGCITKNIHIVPYPFEEGIYLLRMNFTQDPDDKIINRALQTSGILDIRTENGITKVKTENSLYLFEAASIKTFQYADAADLIELYCNHEGIQFCKGIYYDKEKVPHELTYTIRKELFLTSCILTLIEDPHHVITKFYADDRIIFQKPYNYTSNFTQNYLIHNVSDKSLEIRFEEYAKSWTIQPGDKQYIYREK